MLLCFVAFGFSCKEETEVPSEETLVEDPKEPENPSEPTDPNEPGEVTPVEVKYEISFVVDGVTVKTDSVLENTMPTPPSDVTKAEDDNYTYEFSGWNPDIGFAKHDQVYVAKFNQIEKKLKFSSLEGLKLSILGDSISTYYNGDDEPSSYYHEKNQFYYPLYCKEINSYNKT